MNNALIQCPKCHAWLMEGVFNQPRFAPCPACGAALQVEVFPALFRKAGAGQGGEALMIEGESSCFYHPQKKAARPCDGCGRFLCALCDCAVAGGHFCPACIESGQTKGKIKALDNKRTLYDSIALALAVYPLLIFWLTVVTAPLALFVALRYWKKPLGLMRRTRMGFVVAIILACLEIGGWCALIVYFAIFHHA